MFVYRDTVDFPFRVAVVTNRNDLIPREDLKHREPAMLESPVLHSNDNDELAS